MADGRDTFRQALEQVFTNWTVLKLAVDFGWGGRESGVKRKNLFDEFLLLLLDPAKQWKNDDSCRDSLADFLTERVSEFFNCDIEDDSDIDVAAVSLRLLVECKSGEFSYANELIASGIHGAAKTAECQAVCTNDDDDDDSPCQQRMKGMESDGSTTENDDENVRDNGPVVDEDGFTMVTGRRRK